MSILVITGQGFDPNSQIQVNFFNGSGYSVAAPAVLATSTSVTVSVPAFIDSYGGFAAGSVSVKVTQTPTSGPAASSNVLGGFQIQPVAAALPLSPGSLVLAFLSAELQDTLSLPIVGTTLNTPAMQSELSNQVTNLQSAISNVQSVMSGAWVSFGVAQFKGSTISAGPSDLANADRLLLGLLTVLAGVEPDLPTAQGSAAGGTSPNVVQAAAQAALVAATNPLTTTLQLNRAIADLSASLVKADPTLSAGYVTAMLAILGTAAAVSVVGAPTAVVSAWLAGYLVASDAITALTAEVTIAEIVQIGSRLIAQICEGNGLNPFIYIKNFFKGILLAALGELGKAWDWLGFLNDVMSISRTDACVGAGSPSTPLFTVMSASSINGRVDIQLDQSYFYTCGGKSGSSKALQQGSDSLALNVPTDIPSSVTADAAKAVTLDSNAVAAQQGTGCTIIPSFVDTGNGNASASLDLGSSSLSIGGSTAASTQRGSRTPLAIGGGIGTSLVVNDVTPQVVFTVGQRVQYKLTADINWTSPSLVSSIGFLLCPYPTPYDTTQCSVSKGLNGINNPRDLTVPSWSLSQSGTLEAGSYIFAVSAFVELYIDVEVLGFSGGTFSNSSTFHGVLSVTPAP
jgi:hypothetical protein